MKRNTIIISILLIIFLIIGIFLFKGKKADIDYSVEHAQRRNITKSVEASGIVNPVKTVNIGSQVSGIISEIFVDYNSEVKKGQLLAKIDQSLFKAQADKARGDLANARAGYEKANSNLIYKKANYERHERLYKNRYVSKDETEAAYAAYKGAIAELNAAKAMIDQASANLKSNLTNLKYTEIISPVDGVVVSKKVDVGQTVAASFQTPEMFVVAEDLKRMQIEVSVSEADIGEIKIGQEAKYTLDGYPDREFDGEVTQVRLNPTTVSNVTTYTVIVKVDNSDEILKPGMSANVTIITENKKNILCVPNNAFKYVPKNSTERYNSPGVWTLKNKRPVRVEVEKGIRDSEYTEISKGDIEEGTPVLVPKKDKKSKNQIRPPRMF